MMDPYPGECFTVWDAWSSAGGGDYSLYEDIAYRGSYSGETPGHRVLAAGEEWRCWAYAGDWRYLRNQPTEQPDLVLELAWVIEVLGGTGELTLSINLDTEYEMSTTEPFPTAAGTLSVDGAGTYVVDTPWGTDVAAGYSVNGALGLRIECTSGSVDVQQVKLRVWPVGGPLGNWSDPKPAWDGSATTRFRSGLYYPTAPYQSSEGPSMAAANDELDTILEALPTSTPASLSMDQNTSTAPNSMSAFLSTSATGGPGTEQASVLASTLVLAFFVEPAINSSTGLQALRFADAFEEEEVTYIYPPNESNTDDDVISQLVGTPSFSWSSAERTLRLVISSKTPGEPLAGVSIVQWTQAIPDGFLGYSQYVGWDLDVPIKGGTPTLLGTSTTDDMVTIDDGYVVTGPPDGGMTAVAMHWSGLDDKPDVSGYAPGVLFNVFTQYDGTAQIGGLAGTLHHPQYRVWDPAAGSTEPEPEPETPVWVPGYYLTPTASLDGGSDRIDVSFASA